MAYAFHVHLECWVIDGSTGEQILDKMKESFFVQPPAWCHHDMPELKVHLETLGKLQYLYRLRRDDVMAIDEDNHYTICATLKGWDTPPNYNGDRKTVVL